jgi:hypothetical protein
MHLVLPFLENIVILVICLLDLGRTEKKIYRGTKSLGFSKKYKLLSKKTFSGGKKLRLPDYRSASIFQLKSKNTTEKKGDVQTILTNKNYI